MTVLFLLALFTADSVMAQTTNSCTVEAVAGRDSSGPAFPVVAVRFGIDRVAGISVDAAGQLFLADQYSRLFRLDGPLLTLLAGDPAGSYSSHPFHPFH